MESFRGPETLVLRAKYRGPKIQVLRSRSWNLALKAWNPGPESQVLKPRVEGLKPRSWEPGLETSRWGLETQVLIAKYQGPETQVLRVCVRY
jgi:hypothetical protein